MRILSRLALALILVTCCLTPMEAAGTVTVTTTPLLGGTGATAKYTLAWTSTAGGAVSANPFTLTTTGYLLAVKFVPAGGADQPTDLYDGALKDADGIDLLSSLAVDLSNATGKYFLLDPPIYLDGTQQLDLVISNAGDSNKGTVYVWTGRP